MILWSERNLPPLKHNTNQKGRFMAQVNNTLRTGLISINNNSVNGQTIETVNARELHAFLGIGKDFSNWIKDRISQYDFVENQDFIVFANSGENLQGGRPTKDYHISLDMAKEISMVERNDKGKEARQYFIECEKKAKQAPTPALPFIFYLLTIASESPIIHLFNRFGLETRFDLSDYKMSPCRVSCAVFYCHVKASW